MSKRLHNLFHTLVLLAITLSLVHFSSRPGFSADTYIIPDTAEATLAWDPNDPTPDGYCIYQRTEGQSYDYSQPCWTGSDISGTVYNLNRDTTYFFVVRAYMGSLQSADSAEVKFVSPSANNSPYRLLYSISADRSSPDELDGATLNGLIYSFIEPMTNIKRVEFSIDGVLHQTESYAPYDLAGGSRELANPFDTGGLSQGLHTISAQITDTDGNSEIITADVNVSIVDAIHAKYDISSSVGENGGIVPCGTVTVDEGSSQTFTIAGNDGFHIDDVLVDGISIGRVSSYTFEQVAANHTISAIFKIDTHTIIASAGENGSITPEGKADVSHNTSKTYSITPDPGYKVADVLVDGKSIGSASSYTFSQLTANHTIYANFVAKSYAISTNAGENGKISPYGTVALDLGESQTFTFTADPGFHISDVQVDGQSVGTLQAYTFNNVDDNHQLAVTFSENTLVKVWIEAEDGDLQWPMEIADDINAGKGGFIWSPEGTGSFFSLADNAAGYADYQFEVPESGDYFIWGRQMSNDPASDSFFVSVDGQAHVAWHTKLGGKDVWTWDSVSERNVDDPRDANSPKAFWLQAGVHTLSIKQREDGTKLDRILITNEPNSIIYEMIMSSSPDRSGATLLDGAEVRDNIYAFVEPITDIKRVNFFIDGVLQATERYAPYDLSGGSSELANPFDTNALSQGFHTFSAQITTIDGTTEMVNADVFISNSLYKQWFSSFSDRSNPDRLDGKTVEGLIYSFVEPTTDIKRVDFFIDGVLQATERYAPYDLSGGSPDLANPFDTSALGQGLHTFGAEITKIDGTTETIVANVKVDSRDF